MNRSRHVWVVPTLLLVASLALNAVLFRQAESYFRQENEVRLDPLNLAVYASAPPPPAPAPGERRVVLFGDSRIQMWPQPALAHVQFVNRGIGNQTTAQILERYDRHVTPLHPDVVVVEAGVNDLKTIPLFPTQHAEIVQRCKDNLAAIVGRARREGAKVIVLSIFPMGHVGFPRSLFWSGDVDPAIVEVNAYLATLAAGDAVTFVDTAPHLVGPDGTIKPDYARDFIHLNPRGYDALDREVLYPALERAPAAP